MKEEIRRLNKSQTLKMMELTERHYNKMIGTGLLSKEQRKELFRIYYQLEAHLEELDY